METLALAPFQVVAAPRLRLRGIGVPEISSWTVFFLIYASYFLVLGGIIYDLIIEPPSIGQTLDEKTGAYKPQAFMLYRINGQYIIEGLTASSMFVLGGSGFILLDRSNDKHTSSRNRMLMVISGVAMILIAYNMLIVFLKMKVPGYLS